MQRPLTTMRHVVGCVKLITSGFASEVILSEHKVPLAYQKAQQRILGEEARNWSLTIVSAGPPML